MISTTLPAAGTSGRDPSIRLTCDYRSAPPRRGSTVPASPPYGAAAQRTSDPSRRVGGESGPRATETAGVPTRPAGRREPATARGSSAACAPLGPPRRPAQSRTRSSSQGPPSGEDVGRLVVEESVIELRQQPANLVVEAAVARAGGVAGEGAAGHGRRPEVVDTAAMIGGGVADERAVAHRHRPEVANAAAGAGR